jgi:hypothetical protein
MELILSNDQIRIIANAINWTLHVAFHRTPRPTFRVDEVELLELLHGKLCFALHNEREVTLSESQLSIASEAPLDSGTVHHVVRCVRAFDAEIGHSPNEVKVVTNVSIRVLKSLLSDHLLAQH